MEMKIFVEDLCCETIIGILPTERLNPQKVNIHIEITYIYDNKSSYINYSEVAHVAIELIQKGKYELIEDALYDIAKNFFNIFPKIHLLKLRIQKPDILDFCKVSVESTFTSDLF